MLFEAAAVLCLLLWPLVRTAVLPQHYLPAPVPVFHRPLPAPRELGHESQGPVTERPILVVTILRQPPTVPSRVFSGPSDAPVIADPPSIPGSPEGTFDRNRVATAPAPPVANPRPIPVSSGVMAARRIHTVQPEYPAIARMIHLAGTVQLRAVIATDGSVRNLEVVGGNPILAKAAVDAVRQWRYQPTLLSGKPVEVETIVTVEFHTNEP